MKALLMIDLQPDFMSGGPLAVPGADNLIPTINALQPKFELVVATQDWHPKNHESFIINDTDKPGIWPVHCVQGTAGEALHPLLDTKQVSAIIRKGTDKQMDSYSAFYDNGHLKCTGLQGYLREHQVDTLYFCGLCADICVYYSIEDALCAGFKCVLIEDATLPFDAADFKLKRKALLQKGVKCVLSSDQIF